MKSNGFEQLVGLNKDNEEVPRGKVALAFRDLIVEMAESSEAIRPTAFKAAINECIPDFNDAHQHDAFEFLLQLFDTLHEDLKMANEDKSIISELFQSEIIGHRKFKCGFIDPSDDQPPYLILPLPSDKSPITLKSCISEWTREESFDEVNLLWCSKCHRLEAFQMHVRVHKLAKYAIVQFLRFKHGQSGTTKDSRPVEYPIEFDSKELLNPGRPTGKYSLIGVICHIGTVHSGHYESVVRRSTRSRWEWISDDRVREENSDPRNCQNAYLLLYEGISVPYQPGRVQ
jgi:ubiquitin C-terminal hydrolase